MARKFVFMRAHSPARAPRLPPDLRPQLGATNGERSGSESLARARAFLAGRPSGASEADELKSEHECPAQQLGSPSSVSLAPSLVRPPLPGAHLCRSSAASPDGRRLTKTIYIHERAQAAKSFSTSAPPPRPQFYAQTSPLAWPWEYNQISPEHAELVPAEAPAVEHKRRRHCRRSPLPLTTTIYMLTYRGTRDLPRDLLSGRWPGAPPPPPLNIMQPAHGQWLGTSG